MTRTGDERISEIRKRVEAAQALEVKRQHSLVDAGDDWLSLKWHYRQFTNEDVPYLLAEIEKLKSDRYERGDLWNEMVKLRAEIEKRDEAMQIALAALDEAAGGLACAANDLGNCVEEKCVPTVGELNSCKAYWDDAKAALARIAEIMGRERVE